MLLKTSFHSKLIISPVLQCPIWIQLISQHRTVIRDFNSYNRDAAWVSKKTNIEIIEFKLNHYGFALVSSDIDLGNINLLDKHLYLLIQIFPVNLLFL